MRALVIGGAGLIGSDVVDALLARGYHVTILDNLEPEVHPEGRPDWVTSAARFVEGDLRESAVLDLPGAVAGRLADHPGASPARSSSKW